MVDPYVSKIKTNLKKTQGQLQRIQKMIEEDRYCIDIAQQVNAAVGLLKQVNSYVLESHLLCCGAEKLNAKDKKTKEDFAKELVQAFSIKNK
ncbi:MAG: hypothetical protein UY92_C0001G0068 [Candidatus Magasanikbacteria bacterium GW2011_GWA2_56_11]|uniref:Copper-sensing transcriptional repressor CsoR n=1 Tax=Candidatus Magasanikbacteria bacterium GW2011_GWA2_56_11 TaxID=1619044 RepID=A0A0G2BBW1_9BACT|nr:MAG: hypothetical protein UY92_C0001G0068 [Candidatus Magasanikbacteria bacterium GW2011_GWA2_56_11]